MIPVIKKLLYSTDLSQNAAYAFRYAALLAKKLDATIVVLHVVEKMSPDAQLVLMAYLDKKDREKLLKERVSRAIERIKNRLKLFCEKALEKAIQTGTTTVGIMVKDGVVIATDSQASYGSTVGSKQTQKLYKINDFSAATIAGGLADCVYVVNQVRALSRIKEVEEGKVPDPKYIASIVRNMLYSGRSFFMSNMIVGGYSQMEKRATLYGIDMIGTWYEEDKFIAWGSGSPFSLGVLEADWKPNMSKANGIELLKTAITTSKERDLGSGYALQICTIDKAGYKQIQ